MIYSIFNIDDSRKHYTDKIRSQLENWTEVKTRCVNGRNSADLESALDHHGVSVNSDLKVGQLGIWMTVLNAMDEHSTDFFTFEDDAILDADFILRVESLVDRDIPDDYDFFSLFVPQDFQSLSYFYGRVEGHNGRILREATSHYPGGNPRYMVNDRVAKVYQRYGGVSMLYSQKGVSKIMGLVKETGLTDQYDDYLYKHARMGNLTGYTTTPQEGPLVTITGREQSIVQDTELYRRD